jgi:stage V sporulation protein D (sporulation-specific penicillin-binding protein)
MLGKYRMRKKVGVSFLVVGGIFLVLTARVFYINYQNGDVYSKTVLAQQQYTSKVIPYKRGQILDCNGTQLAYSEKVYNLILDVKLLLSDDEYVEPTLSALNKYFQLDEQELRTILRDKPNSQYERLLRNLTADQIKEFNEVLADTENNPDIKGVWFEDSYIRKYPFGSLACDVIGFSVANSSDANTGLENQYNDVLSGTDGVTYGYINENLNIENTTKQPVDGNNIITTLDYGVQSIIEKNIKEFNEQYSTKNTGVIVMDPNNGEILGMASYPVFDLNSPRDLSSIYDEETLANMSDEDKVNAMYELWSNFCVSTTYEPGSTYKPFTVAAALEEGIASDGDTFVCKGYEEVGGWTIKCHEKAGHGTLTLKQAVMYSCNPAMMQIAAKMGNVKFSDYQRRFGMGSKTGIDVPGEETGILINGDLSSSDLATNSFGQNFTVSMIQMAASFSSLINGGNYYQPHVVKRIESSTGEVVQKYEATLVKQTVTSSTSELLKEYLKATVDEGLAKNAKVAGYSMAGKTGTAQKQPRTDEKYVISFLGYASAEDPKFVIYVVLDEPEVEGYSGSSQPVLWLTKSIMNDLLPYMNVFKDSEIAAAEQGSSTSDAEEYDEAPLPSNMSNTLGTSNPDAAGSTNTTLATQAATQAATQSSTQAATQSATQSTTQSATQSATKAATR